jgi:hypothetical protein
MRKRERVELLRNLFSVHGFLPLIDITAASVVSAVTEAA